MPRPTDDDLFSEEQQMVAMSFGDHLEELRVRLVLALLGLAVGMIVMLLPPLNLGMVIMRYMQDPAQEAMQQFYAKSAERRAAAAEAVQETVPPLNAQIPADALLKALRSLAPDAKLADPAQVEGKTIDVPIVLPRSQAIKMVADSAEPRNALISLGPLEPVTIFLMVCLVAGLVAASPWVFYQVWAFIAAGLYRHEQKYIKRFLPGSIGLFLAGVLFCFFAVLPVTLRMLMEFNIWLGIDPSLRITEWMVFATLLPVVFGACFQTPLVMLFLSKIGVFGLTQYREKRKIAILVLVVIAAIITPDPTVITQIMLAIPMIALYEVGVWLVARSERAAKSEALTA